MPSVDYSFLDVAVLDAVRGRLAAGDAIVILSTDLSEIIWANGPGAALFGHADIEAIVGTESGLTFAARRQIMSTRGYPRIGRDRAIIVRLTQGFGSTSFLASAISLPDGEDALMLVVPAEDMGAPEAEVAARAISGFSTPGHLVALLDRNGAIEAASRDFGALGIAPQVLADLVAEVSGEPDRVVKKIIEAGATRLPAGIARLRDDPARHLLVVIDEDRLGDEEPIAAARTDELISSRVSPAEQGDGPDDLPASAPTAQMTEQEPSRYEWPFMDDLPAAPALTAPVSYETGGPTIADAPEKSPATAEDDVAANSETATEQAKGHREALSDIEADAADESVIVNDDAPVLADAPLAETFEAGNPAPEEAGALEENIFETAGEASSEPLASESGASTVADDAAEIDRNAAPIRFVWKTDATGRFSEISREFVGAVGVSVGDVLGRPFAQVSELLMLDPSQEIAGLLERRDTWSGRSVFWPVAGSDRKIPVDLAALPIYSRDRSFEGFRGFGRGASRRHGHRPRHRGSFAEPEARCGAAPETLATAAGEDAPLASG